MTCTLKRLSCTSLLLSCCLSGFTSPAFSAVVTLDETFKKANISLRAGNYAEAYCKLMPLAKIGNAEAQYNIGWLYHNGYGLAINDQEASSWWAKAAAQDHPGASLALGLLYQRGGVDFKKNPQQALRFLAKAAEAGEDEAKPVLGQLIASDPKRALATLPDLYSRRWRSLGTEVKIKVSSANLRAGPGKQHKILAVLKQGESLVELGREGNWVMTLSPAEKRILWIFDSLIEATKP